MQPASSPDPAALLLRACSVDLNRGWVIWSNRVIHLTAIERKLLAYCASHPNRVIPREELLKEVWGYRPSLQTRADSAAVIRLRQKIEADPSEPDHLTTEYGQGYTFRLTDRPAETDTEAPPTSVTPRQHGLIGRDREADWLTERLRQPGLLNIAGPPGVGKRTLVEALVPSKRMFNLDGLDAAGVVQLLCGNLGLTLTGDTPTLTTLVHRALARCSDETFVFQLHRDWAPGVDELLHRLFPPQGSLTAVVVSQLRMPQPNDRTLTLGPLDVSSPDSPGVQLLAQLVRSANPLQAAPRPESLWPLAQRVGGLPVGLQLVARRLRILSVDELTRKIDEQRGLKGLQRQRLDSLMRIGWSELSAPEQWVLGVCAAFSGPVPATWMESLAAGALLEHSVLDPLEELANQGLVHITRIDDEVRIDAIWLAKTFARTHLEPSQWERIQASHVALLAQKGRLSGTAYWQPNQPFIRQFIAEYRHIAHRAPPTSHDAIACTCLASATLSDQDPELAQALLDRIPESERSLPLVCLVQGFVHRRRGQLVSASKAYHLGQTHAKGALAAQLALGIVDAEIRRGGDPNGPLGTAEALAHTLGDDRLTAHVRIARAESASRSGRYDLARECIDEAIALCAPEAFAPLRARAIRTLAVMQMRHGHHAEARSYFEMSLQAYPLETEPREHGHCLVGLALVARGLGDNAEARAHLEAALSLFEATGDRGSTAAARALRAAVLLDQGSPESADAVRHAFALCHAHAPWSLPTCRAAMGVILAQEGRHTEARATVDAARTKAPIFDQWIKLEVALRAAEVERLADNRHGCRRELALGLTLLRQLRAPTTSPFFVAWKELNDWVAAG